MTRTIALLAAGYLARWAQTDGTWPLMQVQCRRTVSRKLTGAGRGATLTGRCLNAVWLLQWGRIKEPSVVCRSCQKAGEAEHGK